MPRQKPNLCLDISSIPPYTPTTPPCIPTSPPHTPKKIVYTSTSPAYTPKKIVYSPTSPLYTPKKSTHTPAPMSPGYTLSSSLQNQNVMKVEPMCIKIESNVSSLDCDEYETWCCVQDIDDSICLHGQKGDKHYIKILRNLHHSQLSMLADTIEKIAKQKKEKSADKFKKLRADEQDGAAFNLQRLKKRKR